MRQHGYADAPFRWQALENFRRQAARLGAEQEVIARLEADIGVAGFAFGRAGKNPSPGNGFSPVFEIGMFLYSGIFVIIQPCTSHALVIKIERDRVNQVQTAAAIGAKAYDIAGIRRNLRLVEHDTKHR